jgi:hypothetical protein
MARLVPDRSAASVWGPLSPEQRSRLFAILPLITNLRPTKEELAPFIERWRPQVSAAPYKDTIVRFFAGWDWRAQLQNLDDSIEMVQFAKSLSFNYDDYRRTSQVWQAQKARVIEKRLSVVAPAAGATPARCITATTARGSCGARTTLRSSRFAVPIITRSTPSRAGTLAKGSSIGWLRRGSLAPCLHLSHLHER